MSALSTRKTQMNTIIIIQLIGNHFLLSQSLYITIHVPAEVSFYAPHKREHIVAALSPCPSLCPSSVRLETY